MSYEVARLDEVTTQSGVEGSSWLRIRKHLGVSAFGVNAYGADAGRRVIEDHDELGSVAGRHEELYLVVRGRARFQLDGEEHDAPTGTAIFVRDPAVQRGAFAEENGTLVLVIGGTRGEAYEVSIWEQAADAYPHWEQGDYGRAVEILRGVAEKYPKGALVLYNLACAECLNGEPEAALEHLRRAVELEERWAEAARNDEDFASLRDDPRFASALAPDAA